MYHIITFSLLTQLLIKSLKTLYLLITLSPLNLSTQPLNPIVSFSQLKNRKQTLTKVLLAPVPPVVLQLAPPVKLLSLLPVRPDEVQVPVEVVVGGVLAPAALAEHDVGVAVLYPAEAARQVGAAAVEGVVARRGPGKGENRSCR